jgi:hypothetical protein
VQIIVYQTQSRFDRENEYVVKKAVRNYNMMRKDKQLKEFVKQYYKIVSQSNRTDFDSSIGPHLEVLKCLNSFKTCLKEFPIFINFLFQAPLSEKFEEVTLPNICPEGNDSCYDLKEEGLFITTLQRSVWSFLFKLIVI